MAYYRPTLLKEALEFLKEHKNSIIPLAGCTDLSVAKHRGDLKAENYLDLTFIQNLNVIKEEDEFLFIGPLVTHSQAAASPVLHEKGAILSQACATVGSPQIRNRGTVGGNICHGSPSGDSIPAFYTLNSELKLQNEDGERWIQISDFFTGPGKTVRKNDELLTAIRFKPLSQDYFCLYQKLGQRKSLACSKASVAFVAKKENARIADVRIAMGAVAPTVIRASKTEEFLAGKQITPELIKKASEMIQDEVTPIDDLRSTACYRKKMMGVLLEKVLEKLK
ncbi:MAG: FAD binding domain-containing protein [Vulcanimicrobiota bacterium]